MLIDTDILIWYMKGNENAYQIVEKQNGFYISVITYIELVQGMRNKEELKETKKALRFWNAQLIHVTEEISSKAMFYIERYFLSHSLQLADALVGATAVVNRIPLLTGNTKHYQAIKELEILPFVP